MTCPSPPRLLAALLGLALALPAAAAGEPAFTFSGRGYGHGVGLSQYGARGAALAGWSAPTILAHYYPGTVLAPAPVAGVRVLVAERATSLALGTAAGAPATARLETGAVVLRDAAGSELARGVPPMAVPAAPDGGVVLGGRRYRGSLTLVASATAGRLDAINAVGLEDYLAGVLPREMPASWGDRTPAALDAQAVAARSYALATRRVGAAYDLHADTRSQVYGGRDGEDPRTTAAVERTRGQVLTFLGRVIPAYFFSTSGGRTESVENAWGGSPQPYLVSVADPFDAISPYHRWPDPPRFGAASLGRRLGLGQPVARMTILARGASPRVRRVRVTGAAGAVRELTGAQVRAALGLRDTWFSVARSGR